MGVSERQLMELERYRASEAFDELERTVLDLAVAMARTPTEVPAELRERLRRSFDERQLVELAAATAWEHFRARFNRVFGVQSSGFSEGAFCVVPERHAAG
jgi:alkylhydroperoxidase family enzyme